MSKYRDPRNCANQILALRGVIEIVNDGRDVIDIQAERVSENQQHGQRSDNRRGQAARIAQDMQDLFAGHRARASEIHAAFSRASIRLTNTSSIEGVIASSFTICIPA